MRKLKNKQKGFTLIELLVVIAIIGILSTLAVVSLGGARERARDAKRLSDMRNTQTALELYFTDNNAYPVATVESSKEKDCLATTPPGWYEGTACAGLETFITVPSDPGTYDYMYKTTDATGTTYRINFTLENAVGDLQSGANCVQPSGITSGACA